MTEPIYERYKDALRRGHVAALRGRNEAALAAYDEAATIAPDRPLPLTSRGNVLARIGRPAEALVEFDRALANAPQDEAALVGRAEALAALGRRTQAAVAFERLADAHDAAGRIASACDATRRALELAESRARRRALRDLVDRLAASSPDAVGQEAIDRATAALEAGPGAAVRRHAAEPTTAAEPDATGGIDTATDADGGSAVDAAPALEAPPPDPNTLAIEAEAALDSGDRAVACERLLALATMHRADGRVDAALDACFLALSVAPDDP
ncbi:MAG: hypothetical protein ACJ77N_15955, partial [Chloroflexota bacterium]